MSFVSTLNKLMEINKTSNIALGKEVGVSDAAVAKWRKGEASPSLDNAMLIAKYYDVSLDELVGNKLSLGGHYRIPILGDVSAGRMALSSLFTGEYLTVDDDDLDGYSREECYALEVYKSTRDIYFVSRALDHKSVEVTKRYLALDLQEDLDEIRSVSPMDKAFRQTGIKVNRNRAYL